MSDDSSPTEPAPSDLLQSDQCAEKLKALGEPLRLRIIEYLRHGPRNVGELATALEVEVVTMSHHLGILKNAGFVNREKQGRFALYSLREGVLTCDDGLGERIDLGCCQLQLPAESEENE